MRIALMALQRVVATGALPPQSAMVEAGLPRILRIRSAQTWSDEDIPDLLASLDDSLNTSVTVMSNFEKYRAEVLSGALDWTPMHTNKQFWAVRFDLEFLVRVIKSDAFTLSFSSVQVLGYG
jgi:V-type H+-transporting ATPase subunit H